MTIQKLMSPVRKACEDYNMIEEGDKIAIGISGGKDSLTLLYALASMRRFYPKKYSLIAITVDLGWNNFDLTEIENLCNELDVEYHIIKTDIYNIVFNERKETNPCSLCAKMRKGALNNAIKDLGCNKVAYAHHKDDVVDTLMLSIIYEGRIHTFSPVTNLDKTGIQVIRPLLYLHEKDVWAFVNKYNVPVVKSPCPVDKHTKREYVKDLLKDINQTAPGVKDRMFTAVKEAKLEGWN